MRAPERPPEWLPNQPPGQPFELGAERRGRFPRIVVATALAGLLIGLVAHAAYAARGAAAPKAKLDQVQQAIEQHKSKRQALDRQAAALAVQVGKLKATTVRVADKIAASEAAVYLARRKLEHVTALEAEAKARLQSRRAELGKTLAALLRLSRIPRGALLASPQSAADTYRASLLLRAIVPALHRRADRLAAEIARFGKLEAESAREQDDLLAERNGLRASREKLRRLLTAKAAAERQTLAAREGESKRLDELAAQATTLKALIEKITAEERRERVLSRPNADEAAAAKAATKEAEARLAALPPPRQPVPGGWVRRPTEGRLIRQFGTKNSLGVVANGDTIAAVPGAVVVAPRPGRVVFAGPFRGYGLLLIIKQAEGYHLLMAGFARIDATVGQWLVAGEPVGQMGGSGEGKSQLYMELRHNNSSVDPLPWLMAGKRKVSG